MANNVEIISRAQDMAAQGNLRGALDLLREGIRADPSSHEKRLALAKLYREAGHPDQAGRWAALTPEWASPTEHDRFLRSIAEWQLNPEHLRELLLLPQDSQIPPQLLSELQSQADVRRLRRKIIQRPSKFSWRYEMTVTTTLWARVLLIVAACVLAVTSLMVFGLTVMEVEISPQPVRGLAFVVLAAIAIAAALSSLSAFVQRSWISATALLAASSASVYVLALLLSK